MQREPANQTDWAAVSARAQAFLCLHLAGLRDKSLTEQAKFLMTLGLSRPDAAALLGSTDDSIRVLLGRVARPARPGARSAGAPDAR